MTRIHTLTKTVLAASLLTSITQIAYAATEDEVTALRNEVAQLKALVMQQQGNPVSATELPTTTIGSISGDRALKKFGDSSTAQNPAPGFKLTTSNGAEVELYGSLRGDASFILEGNDGVQSNVPNVGSASSTMVKDKINTTAQMTRLGLNFKTKVGDGQKLGGKLEADFYNGNTNTNNAGSLRVRHAFLTYNDWLLGQTKSTFLGYSPEVIDVGTIVGTGVTRIPMVRYSHDLKPGTQLLVGLERGQSSASGSNTSYKTPALTARINQNFHGKDGLAMLRGMVENYEVDRTATANITAANDNVTGYGLGAGVNYKFNKAIEGFADVNYTKGTSGLVYGQTNAYVLNGAGDADENAATSWMVGGVFNITPRLRSNVGYSQVNFDDSSDYAKNATIANGTSAASNEKLRDLWANLIFSPVKQVDLGIEYHDGERETFNGTTFSDDRVNVMASYKF